MSFSFSSINKLIIIVIALLLGILVFNLFRSIPISETIILNVDRGYGLNQVIDTLNQRELIKRPLILKAYVRVLISYLQVKPKQNLLLKK